MDIEERSSSSLNHLEGELSKEEELECAVCLQTCVHPVRLPCSHIFCFLCVKGVANQSKRCAMCRQEIPADFLDNPTLLKKIEEKETDTEGYQWFYEGRNGWWQYDQRTSLDLETAYSGGHRLFEVLVAGFLYTVDFDRMVQQRRNDPSRRRRIKRDLGTIPKKGVAGLKTVLGEGDRTEQPEEVEGGGGGGVESADTSTVTPSSMASVLSTEIQVRTDLPSSPVRAEESSSASLDSKTTTFRPPSSIPGPLFERRVSPELESLHLLHSELHRRLYPDFTTMRRRPLPVPSPTAPANTGNSPSHYSSPYVLPSFINDSNSRPGNGGNSQVAVDSPDAGSTQDGEGEFIESITSHIRNLSLESEYYSLDGTEEYSLPNDNEKL